MAQIEFLCLANSHKEGGRCIAGVRCDGGGWVRLVSCEPRGTLRVHQYWIPGSTEPQLLDVVRAGVSGPRPSPHQRENWLIDGSEWSVPHRPAPDTGKPVLDGAVTRGPLLLGSLHACEQAGEFSASLAVIAPRRVRWHVSPQHKTKVDFDLGEASYHLSVTDPALVDRMEHFKPGEYSDAEAGLDPRARYLFTISLSEPFNGICYKLVAGVIRVPEHWQSGA